MKTFIGIDNGTTGSVGIISQNGCQYIKVPIKSELSYTKTKQNITRIDGNKLYEIFQPFIGQDVHLLLERPFINPMYFKASMSGIRAFEATLIVVEMCKFAYQYIDSKEWQKGLLPEGLKGPEQLKPASLEIAKRLFPNIDYKGFKDGDGILLAEWARRKFQ